MPSSSQFPNPTDALTPDEADVRLAALEKAKLTRRQAFGKLGFTFAAAAVAALSSDDLLRAVGRQLERGAKDNRVARQVAQEFKNAGVAFAAPSQCGSLVTATGGISACQNCCMAKYSAGSAALANCLLYCTHDPLFGCGMTPAGCQGVCPEDAPNCRRYLVFCGCFPV